MENKQSSLFNSPTILLTLANVIFYMYTSILSGNLMETSQPVSCFLGQYNKFVLERGYYWQLFTSMFVHANIVHLVGNMIFLLIFGLRAEGLFTKKEYLVIYFGSGLFGNILSLLLWSPNTISVGASGAIFGIFGACIIYIYQSIIAVVFYSFLLLMMSSGYGVNIFAHFGGLVIGLALGYFFAKRRYRVVYKVEYRI